MLKKLRIKFIALNMATVAVVLIVIFTAICVINYQQSMTRVNEALDGAISHASEPTTTLTLSPLASDDQSKDQTQDADQTQDKNQAQDESQTQGQSQDLTPPEIGGMKGGSESIIPVAVYRVESDGTLSTVSERSNASIADDILTQAVSELTDAPEGTGSLDNLGLFYQKRTKEGTIYLAFADMSAAHGWQTLALTLTAVGFAALAAFFVISLFFSRWALRPVAQAWQRQQQFVADASHDLKTPLTVILANTSILLEHPDRSVASQSQWIESTQREAQDMQELVGDLLLLAQLDEHATKPTFELLDMTELLEGELLQFESVAFERNIHLESALDAQVMMAGNRMRLHRLVTTLLDNACKYANGGGNVHVQLHQTVRNIELTVHNTGSAIPAEDLPHIFDRFYRADKARTHDNSGYGLGLAIARAIAEEHGGTLTAASSEAAGTTFTATFPIPT